MKIQVGLRLVEDGWWIGGGLVEVGLRWVEDGWRMGGRLVQKEKA